MLKFFTKLKSLLGRKKGKPNQDPKVFCIGYLRTGSTSLGAALESMGYNHASYDDALYRKFYLKKDTQKLIEYARFYDSFDDKPWIHEDMIPILDREFPASKFIYSARKEESWLESFNRWMFQKTGSYPDLIESLTAFQSHRTFVQNYFKGRRGTDFIEITVGDDEDFLRLKEFLNKETSLTQFPHLNKS